MPKKNSYITVTDQFCGADPRRYPSTDSMLKPGEIKLAMAFDGDYVVLGSGKDQVKQLGNAVTPPAMEWLVQQVVESLK
jgi:site-specific DNA-cytosine methylase